MTLPTIWVEAATKARSVGSEQTRVQVVRRVVATEAGSPPVLKYALAPVTLEIVQMDLPALNKAAYWREIVMLASKLEPGQGIKAPFNGTRPDRVSMYISEAVHKLALYPKRFGRKLDWDHAYVFRKKDGPSGLERYSKMPVERFVADKIT